MKEDKNMNYSNDGKQWQDDAEPPAYAGPSTGSAIVHRSVQLGDTAIAPNSELDHILSQPVLVLKRLRNKSMYTFLRRTNYELEDGAGNLLATLKEDESRVPKWMIPDAGHRRFTVRVYDRHARHVLDIHRSFAVVKPLTTVSLPDGTLVGEAKQHLNLLRNKYSMTAGGSGGGQEFARLCPSLTELTFTVEATAPPASAAPGVAQPIAAQVERSWRDIVRQDVACRAQYALLLDPDAIAQQQQQGRVAIPQAATGRLLGRDERAVLLGAVVSCDFDLFTKESRRATN